MRSRSYVAGALLLLCVACAAEGGRETSGSSEASPASPSGGGGSETDGPSDTTETSPLDRRDIAPEGVAALLSFRVPAQLICSVSLSPGETRSAEIHVGQEARVCFRGFDPDVSVHVVLSRPDGTELATTIAGGSSWSWTPRPGEGNEDFQLTATQEPDPFQDPGILDDPGVFKDPSVGDPSVSESPSTAEPAMLQASASIHVSPATSISVVAYPHSGPPGTTFEIGLSGFEASSTVRMFLYAKVDDSAYPMEFRTELEPVTVDEDGEGISPLRTFADDPPGVYAIITSPPSPTNCYTACADLVVTS